MQSRIGYYNFDAAGKEKADNKVTADTYEDMLIGEIFFMGNDRSVAVGDNGFEIYTGKDTPKQIKEVKVNQEIKVFSIRILILDLSCLIRRSQGMS